MHLTLLTHNWFVRRALWKYKLSAILFACLTVYMIICAVTCTVQAARSPGTPAYARMLVSVIATYASYVFASLLWLDPFHLVTSFLQYVLFSATCVLLILVVLSVQLSFRYINILNVYSLLPYLAISLG